MREIWKPFPNYPTHEVSNLGRVRGPRVTTFGSIKRSPYGRPEKMVVSPTRHSTVSVHRAVLEAFVGECPDGMECCHNDGDPTNNRISNLRWDTRQANQDDIQKHGTRKNPPVKTGESHHMAFLSDEDVRSIRDSAETLDGLAEKYGCSSKTIWRIKKRLTRESA